MNKNKQLLRGIIREVIEEAEHGYDEKQEVMLMKRIQSYAYWGRNNALKRPNVVVSIFDRIAREVDELIKLHGQGKSQQDEISLTPNDRIPEKMQSKHFISKPVKKSETDEWVVKWMTNGKRDENKTYYTNDEKDAWDTYNQMVKNAALSK